MNLFKAVTSSATAFSPELFELPLVERRNARHASSVQRKSEVYWLPVGFLLLLFFFWKGLLGLNTAEQQLVLQAAHRDQDSIAATIAEQIGQTVDSLRLYGNVLATSADPRNNAFHQSVRLALEHDQSIHRMWQFDAKGTLTFSSPNELLGPWATAVADMAHGSEATAVRRLLIARTDNSSDPQQPLLLRTDIIGTQGHETVVAMIDAEHAVDVFGKIPLGSTGTITLSTDTQQELARWPARDAARAEPFEDSRETADSGDFIASERNVRNAPLVVHVRRATSEVLHDKRESDSSRVALFLALSAMATLLLISRLAALLRHDRLEQHLLSIQSSNSALLKEVEAERHAAYVLATHDKLTGLPNRMLFADLSQRCISRARRTNARFAVMFIDLDRFKPINDTYGHKVGDQLLVEVARRLTGCFRDSDVVARFGGDEFVVLIADVRRRQDVALVAKKVIATLNEDFHNIVEDELRISASIGIAFFPDDAQQIDDLIRHADAAMYEAKAMGRSSFAFADRELSRRIELNNEIEMALPFAIEHGEIAVHYQPKVALADYRICGLEALARWTHPRLGNISPADFIPTAERSGLIIELGKHVLRAVCHQLSAWRDAGVPLVPIAVNVSWLQLQSAGFVGFLRDTLAESSVPAELIELEITETGLVHAEGGLLDTLHELRASGFRLAIDDFGTGYSGLSKLRTLPARYLKIDKSFIQDIRNDSHDAAIVSNTISLSRSLHLITIAEGVETAKQVAHLRAVGCDQAQGYLFARPDTAATIEPLMRQCILLPRVSESSDIARQVLPDAVTSTGGEA